MEMTAPKTLADVAKGDVVLLARTRRDGESLHPAEVTRVGRKWGYFDNGWRGARFDLATGHVDDYPYGTVYLTKEHYERDKIGERLKQNWIREWEDFKRSMRDLYAPPPPDKFEELRTAFARVEAAATELKEWTDAPTT